MTSVLILLSGFDPGTYSIEDDGIASNGIAQLRGTDDSVIFFNIPTEFLTVNASAGRSVFFNLTESFGAADINVGNLTNAAENPDSIKLKTIAGAGDVLLVSNGSILEFGSDAAADVTATSLILSASTGVGTSSLALETQAGTLEAEATTGGINLRNFGNVIIGGLTDDVVGLDVETSGNLTLTNFGSIVLSEESPGGFESVHGGTTSGNVTLIANGFDADIVSNVDQDAIAAPGGNITLTAGRDISMGTLGLNFDNDVRARGNLVINTGRDLNIDGFADLASDGFGAATGGDVIVNAGRDINLLNSTGTDGSLGAEGSGGGNVVLNTGPGGFVRLLAGSTATLFSSTGDIEANADRMVISGSSGITASGGDVTIRPVTEGWNVNLGSVTDGAFALELSDAELDRIFTPTLFLGGEDAGAVTVSSSLSPLTAANLAIQSGSDIVVNSGVGITVSGDLTLRAADDIILIAGSAVAAGGVFSAFVDFGNTDPGTGGTAFVDAGFASVVRLFGNADADTLFGGAGGDFLDGQGGADKATGRAGNDTYTVDHASDKTIEEVGEGTDLVKSSVTYTLGDNVENLTLTGIGNINGSGNTLANTLTGNSGNNTLNGGGSTDTLIGGGGNDTLNGGTSIDTASYASAALAVTVALVAGAQATGGAGVDTLIGIENLTGSGFNDTLTGDANANILRGENGLDTLNGEGGNDTLFGGSGVDSMFGGSGADTLVGDSGVDTLVGGLDRDVLTGGASGDFFVFNAINESGVTAGTRDLITDFVQASDKIQLVNIDANTVLGGDQAFTFIGAAAFSGVAGQLRAVPGVASTLIHGDVNGDSTIDFSIGLTGVYALVASDFVL